MFLFTFWCQVLILVSILVFVGIKMVPKVSQTATKMHQQKQYVFRDGPGGSCIYIFQHCYATWSILRAILVPTRF